MRVFVTGATGFIGMAVTRELLGAGHKVLGLARDAAKAPELVALGAETVMGTIQDHAVLAAAATQCDGVIHLAFNHDFSRFAENGADDAAAIEAIGAALKATDKPLIVTGGVAGIVAAYGAVTETDAIPADLPIPRRSEQTALALVGQGINASVMRLPQVHDTARQGLVTYLIAIARERGVLGYIGDGENRWAAGHVSDVAQLYRLALEAATPGAIWHAVGEEGVPLRAICDTLSKRTGLPVRSLNGEEAAAHYGWLAGFAAMDGPASSALTREKLGWNPTGRGLLADLAELDD